MENRFEEFTVKTVIKKANRPSAAGPSGLHYSHLQAALCDGHVENLYEARGALTPTSAGPQDYRTLAALHRTHPMEDPAAVTTGTLEG